MIQKKITEICFHRKKQFNDSKHNKYNTKNPISNYLVSNFCHEIDLMVTGIKFKSLLDVGCGEGLLLKNLSKKMTNKKCCAIDYNFNEIIDSKKNLFFCDVVQASIYEMPFAEKSFDLVICTEVLEHLEDPVAAMEEIFRVCKKYVLLSVPREPIWKLSNLARFSYISDFGNTPGHINHWSSKEFIKFVGERFKLMKVVKPLPWTIVLASTLK